MHSQKKCVFKNELQFVSKLLKEVYKEFQKNKNLGVIFVIRNTENSN
jgi:hypothetical protein